MNAWNTLALLAAIAASGCWSSDTHRKEYLGVAFLDVTDTLERVTIEDIQHYAEWDDIHLARTLRLRPVMDVDQVPVAVVRLRAWNSISDPTTWSATTNDLYRERDISRFWDTVETALDAVYDGPIKLNHTSLMVPLCAELAFLQARPDAADRFIFIGSDMGEFDQGDGQGLDFLKDTATIDLMRADSLCVWRRIPGANELHDLGGVRVTIQFEPESNAQNGWYRVVSRYIERRLLELGATVQVTGKVSKTDVG